MRDLIIIGAGPAGLTAALYAGRARLNTLVLEKMSVGGRILLTETIENYPGFPGGVSTTELICAMEKQVKDLGVEIIPADARAIDCRMKSVATESNKYQASAIIVASGARPRRLGVPGEDSLTGKGVSYCATCDGPLYKNKDVVVVGGGDAVAEEALYLARIAGSVTLVHRRDELRASPILQEKLRKNDRIKLVLSSVVSEIAGAGFVEGVKIKSLLTGQENAHPCQGVFIYIGYTPETAFVAGSIKLDEQGFILTDEALSTSSEGIFASGDCRRKTLYQVITACADGAIAADSVYKYLALKRKG